MTDRDLPGAPVDEVENELGPLDEDGLSFANGLVEMARAERPGAELAERVLEGIAYRQAVTSNLPTSRALSRRSRGRIVSLGIAVLAPAAVLMLWWHPWASPSRVKIEPERAPKLTAPAGAAVAPSSKPVLDPCLERHSAEGHQPLIDDFEDGDDEISLLEGRSGLWRWVRDTDAPGTSPALLPIPRPNARATNRLALHVKGGALRDWGAVVEFNFVPACYDASTYQGISFQAKGPGRIFVAPREVGVIPVANGGTCVEDCHNAHVKKVELDSQWKTYEVRWSEVAQRGYNRPMLDPSRLNSLAFQIHPEDTPYDLWLDDVRFIAR